MKVDQLIINASIHGREGLQQVAIANRVIQDIAPQLNIKNAPTMDLAGDWLSLGGLDLQINGGLGLAFPDLTVADLPKLEQICDYLWQQGVDSFLPTIVTTSVEKIQRSLTVLDKFINSEAHAPATAQIIGVHLEGPFLNRAKRGAHPEKYLLPLTLDNLQKVLGKYARIVKVITLAPELDPSGETLKYLREQNIIISLGHSLATATEAKTAFAQGASMVTHAFNAMPSLHHRQPGLLGEAIINSHVYCGLIADGNHVCPTILELILKASDYDRGIFLVSDALSPMGLADGVYPWDERTITVSNGIARLADGTLSGTTLPLLVGVENLVKWGCEPGRAIAMATESPRQAIRHLGLGIGQAANLLRWNWHKRSRKLTWKRIDLIMDNGQWTMDN